jgi:hypothetical protein
MQLNMKYITYVLSLALSFAFFMLFSKYLVDREALTSYLPWLIYYSAQIVFGFLSWFHFYKPTLGAILLTIFISVMLLAWVILLRPHLEHQYGPHLYESVSVIAGSVLTIALVWVNRDEDDINKYLKLLLSAVPFAFVVYMFVY